MAGRAAIQTELRESQRQAILVRATTKADRCEISTFERASSNTRVATASVRKRSTPCQAKYSNWFGRNYCTVGELAGFITAEFDGALGSLARVEGWQDSGVSVETGLERREIEAASKG